MEKRNKKEKHIKYDPKIADYLRKEKENECSSDVYSSSKYHLFLKVTEMKILLLLLKKSPIHFSQTSTLPL